MRRYNKLCITRYIGNYVIIIRDALLKLNGKKMMLVLSSKKVGKC